MTTRDSPLDISDEDLVLAAMLGSMAAFDELVRRFRGAVLLVAERILGCRDTAEDVAQEAFLLAYKALDQLEDAAKFPAWLCAIARNRALRVASREQRSQATEEMELDRLILKESSELKGDPAEQFAESMEREVIRSALEQLPEEYRMVLELFYYDEWPVARIASFLSVPTTTIKWRLRHGRELMRRRLGELECGV